MAYSLQPMVHQDAPYVTVASRRRKRNPAWVLTLAAEIALFSEPVHAIAGMGPGIGVLGSDGYSRTGRIDHCDLETD